MMLDTLEELVVKEAKIPIAKAKAKSSKALCKELQDDNDALCIKLAKLHKEIDTNS